jgi:chemotaxis protein MotB
MLPTKSHRSPSHRAILGRASVARPFLIILAAVSSLALPACVPYVKYEDAMTKLARANQVNQDLERTLRDAQIGESGMGGDLRAALARIESLETQNAALAREKDLLEQERQTLTDRLHSLPPVPEFEAEGFKVNPDTGGIILPGDVLFAPGKSTVRNEAKQALDQLIGMIQREYPGHTIFVDGHTDNTPIDKSAKVNKDNWDLGAKRAHAVFEYLQEKGVPEERMVLTSRGYAQPVRDVDVNSKAGRAKCRRVELRLKENAD